MPDEHSVYTDGIFSSDFDIVNTRIFTFSFVRNPYARVLSAYLDKIRRPSDQYRIEFCRAHGLNADSEITFYDFLSRIRPVPPHELDGHWRPQADNLLLGGLDIDFIGNVEFFLSDFDVLSHQTRLTTNCYINTRGRNHCTKAELLIDEYYTEKEVLLVNEIYEEDFRAFYYNFNPFDRSPKQRRLEVKAYDKALHHFIRGIGLCGTNKAIAITEMRKALTISNANPFVQTSIDSLCAPNATG
jgi:hypothetical protein